MKNFIVIDGNDGSGKNTQAKMLTESLKRLNREVTMLSFPRYEDTFFGKILKSALAGKYGNFVELDPHLASIPYAADRFMSKSLILQIIGSGGYVVSDRYVSANQIHQGGKILDESERVDFLLWLDQMEYQEFKIPKPGVSIYLDVPLEISLDLMRQKSRDTVEENEKYLANSVEAARWLMTQRPNQWIHVHCASGGVMRSREDIHREIIATLMKRGNI